MSKYDQIDHIEKFNPYHDSKGRFSNAQGSSFMTIRTKDPKKQHMADMAIQREKERNAASTPEVGTRKLKLNEELVRRANDASMFNGGDVKARDAQKEVENYENQFKVQPDWTDEQKAYAAQRHDEYVGLVEQVYNDQLNRSANNPSWAVTGRAGRDMNRANRDTERQMRAYEEGKEKMDRFKETTQKQLDKMVPEAKQIERWRTGNWSHGETISADDPLASKKLAAKLEFHETKQQRMKDMNAYYKKNGTIKGFKGIDDKTAENIDKIVSSGRSGKVFDSYQLTNNNAQIKSTRERLSRQNKLDETRSKTTESGGVAGGFKFSGGSVVQNAGINRLQIVFDGKPDADMRTKLKSEGWRWSPREGAWQRQMTSNAERSAKRILGELMEKSYDSITEVEKNIDEIEHVEKFNPYHDKRGRFASKNGFASFSANPNTKAGKLAIERESKDHPLVGAALNRDYKNENLKDAIEEINSGKANSLSNYIGPDGKLTPEREAVHKQIIDDLLAGKEPVAGQATMTMLGGGPASGKSSVMNPDTSKDKHAVTVDPDDIKKRLPGFKEMAEKDPNAAAFYHEESSALAKRFSEVAYSENYNVVYDGTGDGSVNSVMKKLRGAKEHGYRVEAKYVSIDTEEAVRRNQKRYDDAVAKGETPRLPPVEMVIKTHTKCTDISVAVAKEFDYIEIWDNNGAKGQQKLIAKGGGGKGLVPTDDTAFKRYLSKGSKGLDGFMTLPSGEVVPVE